MTVYCSIYTNNTKIIIIIKKYHYTQRSANQKKSKIFIDLNTKHSENVLKFVNNLTQLINNK